ncbi:MAG: AMP-binding protein [Sedimentisphaerales bacterium]|nr:AMP-binding protein [Sedimentisphaerales bacterium]
MINFLLIHLIKFLLALRYRVRVKGLKQIDQTDGRGILFLPNHPALIDPVIMVSQLYSRFKPRALADEIQIDRFIVRRVARRLGVLPIPDIDRSGSKVAGQVRTVIDNCATILKNNESLLLYPAGRVYRQYLENLRRNSAVERIVREIPEVRVVLVRTTGLWGSSFSWASGKQPSIGKVLWRGFRLLLLNGIFFTPRRQVTIEFIESHDFPRHADRSTINTFLQNFYNENAQPNTYIPYTIWERKDARQLAESTNTRIEGDISLIPPSTQSLVRDYLAKLTGINDFTNDSLLATDLDVDSLASADLLIWLQSEFGFESENLDSIHTVADVMLAAYDKTASAQDKSLKNVPDQWFQTHTEPMRPKNLSNMTITQAFLHQAQRHPDAVIMADQIAGARTWREVVLAILVLKKQIASLPGQYIGIMMPAAVAANILYLATLFSGKTPVMINWTLGRKNLMHCLDSLKVEKILTSKKLIAKLVSQGINLTEIDSRLVCLEDIRSRLGYREKLTALLRSRLSWSSLRKAKVSPVAAVLFTSGSENIPKAVPLTHRNILTNLHDAYECLTFTRNDSILGILPPFHSFGLTVSMLLPITLGVRAVYHANPTQGRTLGQIINAYKVSILIGTPTFLNGIVRTSNAQQLRTLRLVISGAEKCPQHLYNTLARRCPQTEVLEGYGVTECSPIISVNRQGNSVPGTIGKVVPSLDYAIVNENSQQPMATGQTGMLLVRGPSVFEGYLNYNGPSPFVTFQGQAWYRTGDLVWQDDQHTLTFSGRLKRFIKLGGEMISLPAIEAVLDPLYSDDKNQGPTIAVTATPNDDRPEIALFSTKPLERTEVNNHIRAAGLSGLHKIRRLVYVDQLPLLGTGKTDYQALTKKLTSDTPNPTNPQQNRSQQRMPKPDYSGKINNSDNKPHLPRDIPL